MSTDLDRIRRARVEAAEDAAIASIPKHMLDHLEQAQARFKAAGGCPGCGSLILAVHTMPCSELEKDVY